MKAQDKFNNALQQGNKGELIIANWFRVKKGWDIKEYGNTSDWDILLEKGDKSLTIEVKTDRWEHFNYKTSNIFIETRCNGNKSGVWSTKSDLYAFYFPDYGEVYFIKTEDLKKLIGEKQHLLKYKCHSGDRGAVSGFVINRYDCKDEFNYINIGTRCWF